MELAAPGLSPAYRPVDAKKAIPWLVYVVFFAVVNETVFNVSTPAIAATFALSPSGVSWVMTAFIVLFGLGSVVYGRLSDIFSLKRLIVTGIAIYAGGSIMGFALQSFYPAVIAARAIQGAGASAIPALIMVLVARLFPQTERGRVFGYITSTVAFAAGVGPVIGGFVSGTLSWTFLFLIPLLTLPSIPFFLRLLPKETKKSGSVDVFGAGLVAVFITTLTLFLSFGSWYYVAVSGVSLAALVAWILRTRNPFIEPTLFLNRPFRAGMLASFLVFSVAIGVFFLIPLMLSRLRGLSTREIGLVMFPGAISGIVFGTVGGNLADKRGNGLVVALGLSLLAGSLLLASLFLTSRIELVAAVLLLTYVGFSFIQTGLINAASQTLEVGQTGVGMGLFNLTTFISAAVGTSLVARYLGSGWLPLRVNPLVGQSGAFTYGNLLLIFVVIVAAAGAVYYFGSARRAPRSVIKTE